MKCVSLFTGGGGLDIGLSKAGIKTIFATDLEPLCKETYCHPLNFGPDAAFFVGNVSDVTKTLIQNMSGESLNSLDLLVGGPPCPPYSKSRFYRTEKPRALQDPVGDETLRGYIRLLEELNPKAFVFENVHGFAYKVHPEGFKLLSETATRLGYEIEHRIVNAADYGVPQIRMRFIMVGIKGKKFHFPEPAFQDPQEIDGTLFSRVSTPWKTAGDAITDLDSEAMAEDDGHYAGGKHHYLLEQIPPGDNYLFFTEKRGHPNPQFIWRSRYWSFLLKLSPNKPSWTIQARRSNNMGPFHWRNRILRIEEVKRLQTFPDAWHFAGNIEQQWRQVGNAVPPLLAETIAQALVVQMKDQGKRGHRES
jgi:DNA (cytosine-5)-methyltransferase 1